MAEELATPKHESPCRGGFKTRPYGWTFTVKTEALRRRCTYRVGAVCHAQLMDPGSIGF